MRCRADIFVADLARGALPAANPWIDGNLGTRSLHAASGPTLSITPAISCPSVKGKRTTSTNIKFLAVAEQEKPSCICRSEWQNATPLNSNDYLGSLRLRRVDDESRTAARHRRSGTGDAIALATNVSHAGLCLLDENSGQRHETLDWNFLGSRRRVDTSLGKQRAWIHAQCFRALPQHFVVAGRRPPQLRVARLLRHKLVVQGAVSAARPKTSPWAVARRPIVPHQTEFSRLRASRPIPRGDHKISFPGRRRCVQRPRAETSIALSRTRAARVRR